MEDQPPANEQDAIEQETRVKWESLRASFNAWAAQSGEPPSEFDRIVEDQVEYARVTYQQGRADRELEQDSVLWDQVTPEDSDLLQELLDSDPDEGAMHRFLEGNPKFLVQILGGGHGRFQRSKPRLGAEFIPDFLIADMSSIGIQWHAVEIESPRVSFYRQDGLPNNALNHAIGQVREWRRWLMNNLDYARRALDQDGLGLVGIDSRVPGLIVIGRRSDYPEPFNEFRRQMIDHEHIVIHSYDWLVDVARSNRSGQLSVELPRLDEQ